MEQLRHNRQSQVDFEIPNRNCVGSCLSLNWYVFKNISGGNYSLAQTPLIIDAFRKTLIKAADGDLLAMRLVSGHEPDGRATAGLHICLVPLGSVGVESATGECLGVAIVLPQGLGDNERLAIFSVIYRAHNRTGQIRLVMGKAGSMTLQLEKWSQVEGPLNPERYCGPSKEWATIIPMVPDKMRRRSEKFEPWFTRQVNEACKRICVPCPINITASPQPVISGAPSADLVAPLCRRYDNAPRWHFHVTLTFAELVSGPIILGAGRFRGYGLCMPMVTTN